jgi:hypothetical protein
LLVTERKSLDRQPSFLRRIRTPSLKIKLCLFYRCAAWAQPTGLT